jgi:hypothetical protein
MNYNPKSVEILSGLLELLEELIEELDKDVEKSEAEPSSFSFDADKYNQLIIKYFQITNLKRT